MSKPDFITFLHPVEEYARVGKSFVAAEENAWDARSTQLGYEFRHESQAIGSFLHLAEVVSARALAQDCFAIRGRVIDPSKPTVNRRSRERNVDGDITSSDHQWLCLDFDDVQAPEWLVPSDEESRADAIMWAVERNLPATFHDASFYYRWSSSAGVKPWTKLRLHLFFWLSRGVCDRSLKDYFSGWTAVDCALFKPVQPHFIAAPTFSGAPAPFTGKRDGIVRRTQDVVELPDNVLSLADFDKLHHERTKARELARTARAKKLREQDLVLDGDLIRSKAKTALSAACEKILTQPEGGRHNRVRDQAFAIGTWVGACVLDRDIAYSCLLDAAESVIDDEDCDVLVDSGLEKGALKPKDLTNFAVPARGEPHYPHPNADRGKTLKEQNKCIITFSKKHLHWSREPGGANRLLITGSQGTGKTEAMLDGILRADCGAKLIYVATPTLQHAEELELRFRAKLAKNRRPRFQVATLRGRSASVPFRPAERMCVRHEVANRLASHGVNVAEKLCKSCSYRKGCSYRQQIRSLYLMTGARVVFMPHAYLYTERPLEDPDFVVVDEEPVLKAVKKTSLPASFFYPNQSALGVLDPVCAGPDSRAQLLDFVRESVIEGSDALARIRSEPAIAGLLRRELEALQTGSTTLDGMSDEAFLRLDDAAIQNRRALASLVQQLQIEAGRSQREVPISVRYVHNASVHVDGRSERQPRVEIYVTPQPTISPSTPMLFIDGTGSRDLLATVWGDVREQSYRVERDAFVTQVSGKVFTKYDLKTETKSEASEVAEYVRSAFGVKKLVVTCKSVAARISEALGDDATVIHYGALRGIDRFKDFDTVFVVGREQPSSNDIEPVARALLAPSNLDLLSIAGAHYEEECRFRRMRDGSVQGELVRVHPDPFAQTVLEQIREAELLQAIDRVRAIFQHRHIHILTSIVLDISVDIAESWKELRQGGNRLQRVAAASNVIALSDRGLAETCSAIFSSKDAARSWRRRNSNVAGFQIVGLLQERPRLEDGDSRSGWVAAAYRPSGRGQYCPLIVRVNLDVPSLEFEDVQEAAATSLGVEPSNIKLLIDGVVDGEELPPGLFYYEPALDEFVTASTLAKKRELGRRVACATVFGSLTASTCTVARVGGSAG